ncbi:MAG: glycosyl hydrolase, partial [Chloroflexia bacterium]
MFSNHHRYRITLAITLLALCCTILPAQTTQQTAAAAPAASSTLSTPSNPQSSSPFGVAGVMRWPSWGTFNQPADLMLQTGGSWVRDDFVWALIEPKPDEWNWTATDRIVAEIGNRKLNMLGVIAYSVNWATPTGDDNGATLSFYPPDRDKYYTFVRTLVGRYKNVVHHWEIWNEPDNNTFWKPAPNATEYAKLLKVAYRAVKDADPTAKVLTGGVSGNAVPYLEQMLAAGAADSFDILALHPYAIPLDPAQGKVQSRPEVHKILDVELAKYRAFLSRHKLDRPLWVTEIGWPAQDWGLDDNTQADYLSQAFALMLSSGLTERIFAYSFKDQSNKPGDSWGLVAWGNNATDLNPKRASFYAYATSARLLTGTSPGGRVQLVPSTTLVDFESNSTWSRSMQGDGTLTSSTDLKHSGASSGKLSYNLPAQNMAVDFAPPKPVALPGKPTRLGIWALGDGSGDYLSAWLRDKDGELFKVRLGAIMGQGDGWRYYESRINNYYFDWEKAGGSPANGKP